MGSTITCVYCSFRGDDDCNVMVVSESKSNRPLIQTEHRKGIMRDFVVSFTFAPNSLNHPLIRLVNPHYQQNNCLLFIDVINRG